MNLHPIFVHFPVALLTVYCAMEIARLNIFTRQTYWFYLKAVFVMLGGLGALAAFWTGDMAKLDVRTGAAPLSVSNFNQVVAMHENFADLTVAIFGILAASYLILWMHRENFASILKSQNLQKFWAWLVKIASFFADSKWSVAFAIIGLIVITITGGLGGRIVYGPNADPFLKPVLDMLVGK